jgi:single-strand DNA-binding protein
LQTRHWDDKEGNKHSSVEIVANEMMMLGDRRDSNNTEKHVAETADESELPSADEDEFPF